ncbi:putative oxidoreductase, aryl-alcohol dehydrogenase like protein [Rhizobium leguminosarum bv. trifolii WSM2297]|uniref:Putative oxidoreductase, aryl-alcohol dehydrogenase like protein n=1 Tax=Rhizobium leguminosarum bv. trifolii WSM2297 TaxID=754762 RepID=J0WBY6_RHILT|nr:aldo/keto reductase [Rhizobium leguminosarum]EJC82693.1 putative oxidoreductase, aryl-alcohol dehydrogenase like protein [Rhizobium leguminosarum bv. trifolii WSM2297]
MKLSLGTAQFGLTYGVSNTIGQPTEEEVALIIARARQHGIRTIDTATAYGDAEMILGEVGIEGFDIVTKIGGVDGPDLANEVRSSLSRLRISSLHGLLLHRPYELLADQGAGLQDAMEQLRTAEVVKKIGVSVYDPSDLDAIIPVFRPDIVQLPHNIFDRRMERSGWLQRLKDMEVEIHVRSVFLQGLLVMPSSARPARFARWQPLWEQYENWLRKVGLTPVEACLGFALANPLVDRVIVGLVNTEQMEEVLSVNPLTESVPQILASDDQFMINPSLWNS